MAFNCIFNYFLNKQNNDLLFHSMENKIFNCKIVNVYDGDTCNGVIFYNFKFCKFKIRMHGYDSPELKPLKSKENRELEIENAKKSKNALSDLILNKIVKLHCGKFDKYGRLLGTIYINKININDWMVENNFGYKYYGGTKK